MSIYNTTFLVFLGISQFAIKGLLNSLISYSYFKIMDSFNIEVSKMESLSVILFVPWIIKPLVGIVNDTVLIRGYISYWILLQATIIGILGGIIIIGESILSENVILLMISFAMINYEIASIDIICESKYSKIMVENDGDLNINMFNQVLWNIGSIASIIIVGFCNINVILCVIISLTFVPLFPVLFNLFGEERKTVKPSYNSNMIILSVIVSAFGISLGFLSLLDSPLIVGFTILMFYTIILVMVYHTMNVTTFKFVLYIIIISFTWCDYTNAFYSYFTSECGLGLSYEFYILLCAISGLSISVISASLFNKIFGKLRFPLLVFITDNMQNLCMIFYALVIYSGYNSKPIIILLYVLNSVTGTNFTISLFGMFSKCIVKDHETMSFAIIVGIFNLTTAVNIWYSSQLYSLFDISNCDFDNLWIMVALFNCVIPSVASFLSFLLIPNIKQNESVNNLNTEIIEIELDEY